MCSGPEAGSMDIAGLRRVSLRHLPVTALLGMCPLLPPCSPTLSPPQPGPPRHLMPTISSYRGGAWPSAAFSACRHWLPAPHAPHAPHAANALTRWWPAAHAAHAPHYAHHAHTLAAYLPLHSSSCLPHTFANTHALALLIAPTCAGACVSVCFVCVCLMTAPTFLLIILHTLTHLTTPTPDTPHPSTRTPTAAPGPVRPGARPPARCPAGRAAHTCGTATPIAAASASVSPSRPESLLLRSL
jgi:hypothetical protein